MKIVQEEIKSGVIYEMNGKLYSKCADCHKLVRIDKPIIGDLHLCK